MKMLTDDLVESRNEFREMKNDVSKLVKDFGGEGIDWSYDEFCKKLINNLEKKQMKSDSSANEIKKMVLDSIVEMSIEELKRRGKHSESEVVSRILNNNGYEEI